jgi:hypothetical protein
MRALSPPRPLARWALLAAFAVLVAVSPAQDKPAKPGKPDREEKGESREMKRSSGEKPGRDPGAEAARSLVRLREAMRVTDDAEWAVIAERIAAVQAAGAGPKDKAKPAGPERTAQDALRVAVRDGLPDAELRLRLARAHELQREREARLARARAELRAVLTVRQEAVAVLAGLLEPAP